MSDTPSNSHAADKPLFTPGPLTTSMTVKQAMLRDLGSRDQVFIDIVRRVRAALLQVAGLKPEDGYETILLQGSGTFAVEAVLTCAIPADGKWLIITNGAYGDRMRKIASVHRLDHAVLKFAEDTPPDPADVEKALREDPDISAVAAVHCETTTGLMNPIREIGQAAARHQKTYFVDSMSAFGAVEFDFMDCKIDYLVSSANKCIEGVPGFSFCIANREKLLATEGWARTLVLDLLDQWKGLERNGQFRFTPPTHAILAFAQALDELQAEGGPAGRARRYVANHRCIVDGMYALGFRTYLAADLQGHIITSFRYPDEPGFEFQQFYDRLNEMGFVIYPGKVSNADCFRIGHIGRIGESESLALLAAIRETLEAMGVRLRHSTSSA